MSGLGTMALEYGGRIDFARLRRERLDRCRAEMERSGLDALILGRESNARYASGARRLWTVGMRPFAPGCVVMRDGPSVHLLNTWDEGIPDEIPRQNLMQTSWDPRNLVARLTRIPGLPDVRRAGVDGMTPLFDRLLPSALPRAELVDATPALMRARVTKTRDEVAAIRTAVAIAEGALAAVARDVEPGVPERSLVGRFLEEASRLGVTVPALEGTFCATPREARDGDAAPLRQLVTDRPLEAGDLVVCHAGVMYAGYEGGAARTVFCGGGAASAASGSGAASVARHELAERLETLRGALRDACRAGGLVADVCRVYGSLGEPLPNLPVVHGVGLGVEPPIAGGSVGDPDAAGADATFEPGMVVALYGYVWREGVGGALARDTVLVSSQGAELLNRPASGFQRA